MSAGNVLSSSYGLYIIIGLIVSGCITCCNYMEDKQLSGERKTANRENWEAQNNYSNIRYEKERIIEKMNDKDSEEYKQKYQENLKITKKEHPPLQPGDEISFKLIGHDNNIHGKIINISEEKIILINNLGRKQTFPVAWIADNDKEKLSAQAYEKNICQKADERTKKQFQEQLAEVEERLITAREKYKKTKKESDTIEQQIDEKRGTQNTNEAWCAVQKFVSNELKSPTSANFPQEANIAITYLGNDVYQADSYVDAANSFGGTIRTHFICKVEGSGSRFNLVSLYFK